MDDNSSFPEETMVMTDSNFQGAARSAPTNPKPTPPEEKQKPVKPKNKNTGKIVAAVFGLLLLVGGIGAGLVLINQQQIFKQKAATQNSLSCSDLNSPS